MKMQQTKREAVAARLLSSNGIAMVGRQLRDGDMVLMNRQVSHSCFGCGVCLFGLVWFGLVWFGLDWIGLQEREGGMIECRFLLCIYLVFRL